MKALRSEDLLDIRGAGAIDLATLQRYINFWFSSSLDLFGAEISSNAATYFATGIKGRPDEAKFADHLALNELLLLDIPDPVRGAVPEAVPMRNAMNEVTRTAYIADCEIGIRAWNRLIAKAGFDFKLMLPSPRFHRSVGVWAGVDVAPTGKPISAAQFAAQRQEWLPSAADRAFIASLMERVDEPGRMAAWLAPPEIGIDGLPAAYEYVRLN
jgi:benzoyl-CoA 2,3-dioxygenase component B